MTYPVLFRWSRGFAGPARGLLLLLALRSTSPALAASTPLVRAVPTPGTPAPARPCRDAYEDDGVPAQAPAIALDQTQAHTFCPAGDSDWLRFYATAGVTYRLHTGNSTPAVSSYLYLFAPDGQTLLARND